MIHIHKNVDGTYYIEVIVKDDSGRQIINFHGNFAPVEGEREKDPNGFTLDLPDTDVNK